MLQDPSPSQESEIAAAIDRLAQALSDQAAAEPNSGFISETPEPLNWSWDSLKELLILAKDKAIDFAPNLGAALAVLFVGWLLSRLLTRVLGKVLERAKVDGTLVSFLCSTAYMGLMAFVIISAIGQLGINTASFVAILGAATFAIGFALQGSLSNFASGVLMILFRPIRQGDLVEAGGVTGVVDDVGVFATVINTLENKRAIVANGNIMGQNIINYTANGMLRVDMTFGIGYDDDMNLAVAAMREVLERDDRILKTPAPTIACVEHGASSVNFVCRPYVKPEHYWDVWFDTHQAVKEAFDAQGITIPYPQRDVHLIPVEA